MDRNPPIETLRDGALKATLWENQAEKGETYFTVTLAKTYEDRDGKLQDTTSFSQGDLLRVAELAREAHGAIRDIRRDRNHERKADAHRDAPAREDRNTRSSRFRRDPEPGLGR